MAKGKHAAALFEVIQSDKRFQRKEGQSSAALNTPSWWFKRRDAEKAAATALADSQAAAPATPPAPPGLGIGASPQLDVKLDGDRQQIAFRLNYTTAIVGGFALIVVLILAYVLGHRTGMSPAPVLGSAATEQIRRGPAQPTALEVAPAPNTTATPMAAVTPVAPAASTWNDVRPPATVVAQDPKRIIGLNYVVIQSYPDEKSATDAMDLLTQNGVPCTVEKALPGWGASWYSVVGTTGFDKVRGSREYEEYVRSLESLSNKFAGNSKFKRFAPQAYKWKDAR